MLDDHEKVFGIFPCGREELNDRAGNSRSDLECNQPHGHPYSGYTLAMVTEGRRDASQETDNFSPLAQSAQKDVRGVLMAKLPTQKTGAPCEHVLATPVNVIECL